MHSPDCNVDDVWMNVLSFGRVACCRTLIEPICIQEKKQQQLAALDSQYQAKIMSEVERYQALLQEKELLNHKWDEQNATLVEAHEKVLH